MYGDKDTRPDLSVQLEQNMAVSQSPDRSDEQLQFPATRTQRLLQQQQAADSLTHTRFGRGAAAAHSSPPPPLPPLPPAALQRSSIDQTQRPFSLSNKRESTPYIGTFPEFENSTFSFKMPDELTPSSRKDSFGASDAHSSDAEAPVEKPDPNAQDFPDGQDPNLVGWDGPDDPDNPQNWSLTRRWLTTGMAGSLTMAITFASSIFSTATEQTSKEFGVSTEVMTLGTSLFVIGFAVGPIVWGPFSELFGRRYPLYFGYFAFAVFNIPVAVAKNLETIFICRFLGGFFGSAPLAVVGGVLADMWDPVKKGYAFCVFSGATFIGPSLGPIIGSFVTESHLGWRWTAWLTAILAFSLFSATIFFFPETFGPVILTARARRRRFETKNWALHSDPETRQVSGRDIVRRYLSRPFTMLVMEPILILMTLYMSLVYGILYLFFESYPIAFQQQRGWSPGPGSLPFIAIMVGVAGSIVLIVVNTKYRFRRKMEQAGRVIPEERLIPMIVGGFMLPAGLFWFAWTSNPHITPWPQIVAGVPIGCGVMLIFLQGMTYITDVYTMNANSALAANTIARSLVGGGFPLFAAPMFHNLGVPWATSLLAFLCVALLPVPVLFYLFGAKIRSWSKFVPAH